MKLHNEGSNIYNEDGVLVARCLTSASANHEVTAEDAIELAEKIVAAANGTSTKRKGKK